MYAQTINGVWFDVGQPFELINAQAALMAQYHDLPFSYPTSYRQDGDVLHADNATLDGDVARSVFGDATVVEAGASVVDSLLMDGCRVGSGATVSGLGDRAWRVDSPNTVLNACVVGDGADLVPGASYVNEKLANEAIQ